VGFTDMDTPPVATATRCQFRLLGPLELEVDGGPADVGGPRQRAILALLLLARNRQVGREEIVDHVWGPDAPATASHAVEVYVSKLRRWTDPGAARGAHQVLRGVAGGYVLHAPGGSVDVVRFEELVRLADAAAHRDERETAASLAAAALALWRGPALAGLRDFEFVARAADRLEDLRAVAAEHQARALAARGGVEGLPEIESLVAANPLREGLVEQLMVAKHRAGDPAGAMATYHRARRALVHELGVEPSARLRALATEITNEGVTSGSHRRVGLGVPTKLVVGRAAEVASVVEMVRQRGLVTITGFPGVGKTTVAAEVCRALEAEFDGEVHVVDLALVRDPRDVPDHIARALGLQDQTVKRTLGVLDTYLAGRRLLLVFDNCDHLAAVLRAQDEDRSRSPELRLLVTSVSAIGLAGESVFNLGPLSLPATAAPIDMAASGAVALMRDRLLMVDPDFEPRPQDNDAIFRICHRLDGLPLAIELAAARTTVLSLPQLARLLERDLSLLSVNPGGAHPTRRSLDSALESTHAALSGREKRLLSAAACFNGSIDADLLLEVAGITSVRPDEVLRMVDSLVARALLARSRMGGEQRLRMLHATREFTLRKTRASLLGACRERHTQCFARLCERLIPALERGDQVPALERIEEQLDNIRAALRGLLAAGEAPRVLAIAGGLGRFWWARGHLTEGRRWLQESLAASMEPSLDRAEGLRVLAYLEWSQGALGDAHRHCLEALEIAEELADQRSIARSCHYLGVALHALGRLAEARASLRRALAVVRTLPDEALEGLVLDMLARSMLSSGSQAQARGAHERALILLQNANDAFGVAVCLINVAEVRERDGEHQPARSAYLEALERFRALNCVVGEGYALQGLAWIAGTTGNRSEARRLVEKMRERWDRIGFVPTMEDDARNTEILGESAARP
jgi:predicted ATPase/DNA-binding SARP family transcriptional activator